MTYTVFASVSGNLITLIYFCVTEIVILENMAEQLVVEDLEHVEEEEDDDDDDDEEDEDETDDSQEEDDSDSDQEPKLKYERIQNKLEEILNKEAASCMAVHTKVMSKVISNHAIYARNSKNGH